MLRVGLQIAVLLIIIDAVICQRIKHEFNCKRHSYDCKNGGTCENTTCNCPAEYVGQDCGVLKADQERCTAEENPCKNGICHKTETGDPQCYCPVTHYGATCEKETESWECLGTEAKVIAVYPVNFVGQVYVSKDRSNCKFNNKASADGQYRELSFDIKFDKNNSCHPEELINTPNEGDVTFKSELVVTYHPVFTTSNDRHISLNCTHPSSNMSVEAEMGSDLNEYANLTKSEDKQMYHPVEFMFLDKYGDSLAQAVFVGEPFSNMVYLKSTDVYKELLIDMCIVSDGKDPSQGGREVAILENGCPTKDGVYVMQDPPGQQKSTHNPNGRTEEFPAKILRLMGFKFHSDSKGSNQVFVSCVVKICKETELAACEIPSCDASSPAVRRRRSADDKLSNATAEQTVSSVFIVRDEIAITKERRISKADPSAKECFRSQEIVTVIIVMSALVLIMLIACTILACLIIRSKGRIQKIVKDSRDNGYHIPRPKI